MSMDVSEAFALALTHYRERRLAETERLCREILQVSTGYSFAWNLLGIVAYEVGQFEVSLQLFSNALQLAPQDADVHSNLGMALQALGRFDAAIESYQQAIAINPSNTAALDNLGNCLHELGRFGEADAFHRKAIALDPNFAAAYNNLGNTCSALGNEAEAMDCFRRVLVLQPDHAAAHNNLGTALLKQKALEDAERSFRRAIEIQPTLAEAHNNLGAVRKEQRDFPAAVVHFRQAVALKPNYVEALNNLGSALLEQGELDPAMATFRLVLTLTPTAEAHDRLANALRLGGEYVDAQQHLQLALQLKPELASAHANLGAVMHATGAVREAIAHYRRSLELDPKYVFAHTSLGQALMAVGDRREAVEHFREAIAIDPNSAFAHWLLVTNGSKSASGAIISRLQELLADPRAGEYDRCLLHFALAHAFDGAADYDRALAHARTANDLKKRQLKRRGVEFKIVEHVGAVERIIQTYTSDFFAAAKAAGADSEVPIFIVGMPRSGTTLVEQILASHAEIYGAGELDHIAELAAHIEALPRFAQPHLWQPAEIAHLRAVGADHLQMLARVSGNARRVVDKMPTNFLHLGLIAMLYPQARIIHCRRDARDVMLSCYLQNFSSDAMHFTFDVNDLGGYLQQYQRLMSHWQKVLPLPVLDVTYEELVHDQEGVSRRMVDFCGLAWDPNCLDFHTTERTVTTASAAQVREPMHTQSVARWRNYQSHFYSLAHLVPTPPAERISN
jgi:tetratricopeptide (TPR) repeat protein